MIEACAAFSLLTQSVSVSGGGEDLSFSALRLRSERQIKSVQVITKWIPSLFSDFTIHFVSAGAIRNVALSFRHDKQEHF